MSRCPPGLAGWLAEPAMTADLLNGLEASLLDDLTAAADRIEPAATRLFEAFAAGLR